MPTKTVSAAHVSKTLKDRKFSKYTEEGSAIRGYPSRYSGFKVSIQSDGSVRVTYRLGNDHEAWKFNNNRPGTEDARIEAITKQVASYAYWLTKAGYTFDDGQTYLVVTGRVS